MAELNTDLSTLSRAPQPGPAVPRRAAWLLPAAILFGFAAMFLLLFRDRLIPAKEVRVSPALAIEEKIPVSTAPNVATGKLLFQASGWIEPDPLPIKATALNDGVVDQVKVLEGQLVKKGDLLATLVEADSLLEVETAKNELEMTKANFDAHCTNTNITLQQLEGEKASLAMDRASAEEASDRLRRFEQAVTSAIELERVSARFENTRRQSALIAREAKIQEMSHQLTRIAFEAAALQAQIKTSETALAKARLAHERTKILAPCDGRILRLMAAPGQKKMLNMDEEDSSTIAILYQPDHLQVRVDVPLADAAGLSVGQKAKVRCNLLPDRIFEGEVTRITGAADLQRNTLQAKVRISNPDEKLRPEMLCRVEFLDTHPNTASLPGDQSGIAVYVPENAIHQNTIWICDPETKRAHRREVSVAKEARQHFQRIDQGIKPGEWVILDPKDLKENQRLNPKL